MRPMLGWEVIEGKQDFFIFLQAFAGLRKFDLVTGDELIVGCQSRFTGRRQIHFILKTAVERKSSEFSAAGQSWQRTVKRTSVEIFFKDLGQNPPPAFCQTQLLRSA